MTGSALLFETDWRERAAPFIDGIKREARGSASRFVVVYTGQSSNKHHHHAVYIYTSRSFPFSRSCSFPCVGWFLRPWFRRPGFCGFEAPARGIRNGKGSAFVVMMWFFVHGSTVGETTGKPVGLVPFVVFVVAVFRLVLFFLPLLFRCITQRSSRSTSCKRSSSYRVPVWFPIASVPSPSPRSGFLPVFFPSCCLWLVSCLSSSACRPPAAKSSSFTNGHGRVGRFFFLSLPCSLPFFGRFLVSILGESATGRCYRGSRREQDCVFKDTSCLPLLLPIHRGGVYE